MSVLQMCRTRVIGSPRSRYGYTTSQERTAPYFRIYYRASPKAAESTSHACFHQAPDIARRQQAKSLELHAAFDALQNRHDVQWLVELTAAANSYGFLSGIVNAFEVPVPPDGEKLPT